MSPVCGIFKASALWADAFYKSKCPSVCLSVCLFVRLSVCSLLEVPFNGLFAPTSRSRMSNIFRDSESLGKSNGKKWSHIQTFLFGSGLKSPRKKKFFFADFALQNMVETTLPDGLETSGQSFCVFEDFFRFSKFFGFWVFLVHPTVVSVLLSASVERCFVSRMRDFLSPLLTRTNFLFSGRWLRVSAV